MSLLQITHGHSWIPSNCMGIRIALFDGKGLQFIQPGERNFYEIVNFLKPIYRLMHSYALQKGRFLKTHFLPPIQKKIFPYIQTPQATPGLSNNRIDRGSFHPHNLSLFVSLTENFLLKLGYDFTSPISFTVSVVMSGRQESSFASTASISTRTIGFLGSHFRQRFSIPDWLRRMQV
jgi:hypothetical protein